jgi:2-amino-4-hydroxy-6-hydroxymethyldihydropteridine diphosphokinase
VQYHAGLCWQPWFIECDALTHTVYIALGSNIGDRLQNLQAAIDAMPPQVIVQSASKIYETAPWGVLDQPDFLNQVLEVETDLSPEALLAFIKNIEAKLGRQQTIRYGPRRIDLDILFYEERVMDVQGLQIPHPRLHDRAFVLVPLADLAPDLRHPQTGKTIRELLAQLDTSDVKPYYQPTRHP